MFVVDGAGLRGWRCAETFASFRSFFFSFADGL